MSKKPTSKPNRPRASVPAAESGSASAPDPLAAEGASPETPPPAAAADNAPEQPAAPAEETAAPSKPTTEATTGPTSGPAAEPIGEPPPASEPMPPPLRPDLRARVVASPGSYGIAIVLGAVIGIAVLAGATYATLPLWASYFERTAPPPEELADVARLRARLDALEAQSPPAERSEAPLQDLEARRTQLSGEVQQLIERMNELEEGIRNASRIIQATAAPAAAAEARDSLQDLNERLLKVEQSREAVDVLSQRIAGIEKKEKEGDGAEIDDLKARNERLASALSNLSEKVGSIEKERADQAGVERRRRLLTSIEGLRESLRSPGPFAAELAALKDVAGDNREILGIVAIVAPYAETGIPSLAVIQRRFDGALLRIAQAGQTADGDGLIERAVQRLSSLVTVRKIDPAAGDDLDNILARAEASVAEGNLIEAVKALGDLSGPAAEAAKPWRADAEARIAAERAGALLHVQVVNLIGAGGG